MSSEATGAKPPAGATAKQAPTEQQQSQPGAPRRLATGQTVCNEKNEKGKLCNGHLKQLNTQHPSHVYLRGDDALHRCQACGALYMGPPMGHVRDPRKQQRYVERDLAAILQAAGGTLPAYDYPTPAWRGEPPPRVKPASKPSPELAAKPAPAARPDPAAPAVKDSSTSADAHRPAAEAQAATGQASAAPLSPTAATASPAAGAATVSDLAPEASTELTPGAPRDERAKEAAPPAAAKPAPAAKKKGAAHGFKIADEFRPQPNETPEQKIARLKRLAEEAKRAAGKL
jgi:lysophospholipase